MGRITIEDAITAYRAELAADQSLGDDTLDELTEHLHTAIDDRIAAGDDEATAIDAARRRFGEPRTLARECARVRSSAGPRTSYARAWGAAALSVLWTWLSIRNQVEPTPAYLVCGAVLVGGLIARLPQATAFMFGLVIAMIGADLSSLLVWNIHGTWIPGTVDIPTTFIEVTMLALMGWGYRPSRAAKVMIGLGIVCLVTYWSGEDMWRVFLGARLASMWPATGHYEFLAYEMFPVVLAFACIGSVFGTRWGRWLSAVVAVGLAAGLATEIICWLGFWPDPEVFLLHPPISMYALQAVALVGAVAAVAFGSQSQRPFRVALDDLRAGFA